MARYAHERYGIPGDTYVPAGAGSEAAGPTVRFPFNNAAEYAAARSLAAARQQIAHEATYLDTWEELTEKDQEMAARGAWVPDSTTTFTPSSCPAGGPPVTRSRALYRSWPADR
jgi:hypothetical protein